MKNKIILDTGALLEYFTLLIESKSIGLTKNKKRKLNLFLEFFKERELYIVPQVLAELYSLLKRDAKDSNSKLK
jgi:predicted nucleic acid-binding protein